MSELKEIKEDVKAILRILNGNGKVGLVAKCQQVYDWMIRVKSDKHSIGMLAYRTVLVLGIGFIAVRLGIK